MIQVPGYYAKKKKMKVNIPTDRTSAQPLESGRAIETGQPREEEGCNANLVTTPLLRNNPLGVKSLSKTVNSSSILDNSVIIGELLEDDNSGKDSNVIDEELRRVGRDVEAAEFQNNTKPREVLSEAHETLPISHASHVVPRVSPSNKNRRILPGWTRRNRGITNVGQSQGQPISGQKRNLEESEENFGVFAKPIHASQIDG